MSYDLKITGGTLIDGSGQPGYRGDVGIRDGRIVALGNAPESSQRTIAADGAVVAPGFVDIHTHYDAQVLWDPLLSISPWHGVTTAVMGNCGFTMAPTRPEHRDLILRTFERVEGMTLPALEAGLGADWGFTDFPSYLDLVEKRGTGINVAALVGHTPVRLYVMGEASVERVATEEEIAQMQTVVREAMRAGAVGFSTSVTNAHFGFDGKPVPSRLADKREHLAMAQALRDVNAGVLHIAGGRDPAWEDYADLARAAGRPVSWGFLMASQLGPGTHRQLLDRAASYIDAGVPMYPQTACRPIIFEYDWNDPVGLATWPVLRPIIQARDAAERMRLYADESYRARWRAVIDGTDSNAAGFSGGAIEAEMRRRSFLTSEISYSPRDPSLEGRKLVDAAAASGRHVIDWLFDMNIATELKLRIRTAVANFDEEGVGEILRDPNVVLGLGDAGAHMSQLCDGCYTTHLLGHWVREKKVLSLERAVHMLTGRPADIFGLTDRGHLAVGRPADVVVFDPATVAAGPLERVRDQPANSERMVSRASGIEAVVVNGRVLPPPGQAWPTSEVLPGRLLRHGHATN